MPHSRPLPTPSYPSTVNCTTFYGAATIAAPAPLIWSTLLDFPSYGQWNTLTPMIRISPSSPSSPTTSPPHPPPISSFPSSSTGLALIAGVTQLSITAYIPRRRRRRRQQQQQQQQQPPPRGKAYQTRGLVTRVAAAVEEARAEAEEAATESASYELSWRHLPASRLLARHPSLFHAERVCQIDNFGDGNCELRSFITVGGALRGWLCWWWGWNGGGAGAGAGAKGGGGMDEAMRSFTQDVGAEVADRLLASGALGDDSGEGGRGAGGGIEGEKERAEEEIVNPERKVEQAWIAP